MKEVLINLLKKKEILSHLVKASHFQPRKVLSTLISFYDLYNVEFCSTGQFSLEKDLSLSLSTLIAF